MGNTVTNVHVKFNYDRLHTGKALGNLWKSVTTGTSLWHSGTISRSKDHVSEEEESC